MSRKKNLRRKAQESPTTVGANFRSYTLCVYPALNHGAGFIRPSDPEMSVSVALPYPYGSVGATVFFT